MKGKSRPVGQIFANPQSTVTLKVVEIKAAKDNDWCRGCYYRKLTNQECRAFQDSFLGECLSFRRNDNTKVVFKKI